MRVLVLLIVQQALAHSAQHQLQAGNKNNKQNSVSWDIMIHIVFCVSRTPLFQFSHARLELGYSALRNPQSLPLCGSQMLPEEVTDCPSVNACVSFCSV